MCKKQFSDAIKLMLVVPVNGFIETATEVPCGKESLMGRVCVLVAELSDEILFNPESTVSPCAPYSAVIAGVLIDPIFLLVGKMMLLVAAIKVPPAVLNSYVISRSPLIVPVIVPSMLKKPEIIRS